jgi:hypothetical protein
MILVKHIKGVHEIYLICRDSFFITKIYLNIKQKIFYISFINDCT